MPQLPIKTCSVCGMVFKNHQDLLNSGSHWIKAGDEILYFNCACGSTLMIKGNKYLGLSMVYLQANLPLPLTNIYPTTEK